MVVIYLNKYYANREMAYPFTVINQEDYEKESIEQRNFINELFESLLLEIDGRLSGASLLCEMCAGDVLDSSYVENEDFYLYEVILCEKDLNELIIDEDVLLIAKKRVDAFKTFYDAIDKAYKDFKAGVIDGN